MEQMFDVDWKTKINELCWNCKKSVKEFAEKLRKKVISLNVWEFGEIDVIDVDDIDELLKEYEG